ncbi:MAG TPA: hypothetical protein PLT75_05820 [Spirochaetota bacterium]|nr:hypothetical protein [Spirochaetota bacterium]
MKIRTRVVLINIVFLFLLIIMLPGIIMSPMMFDAPGSENSIPTNLMFYSLILYIPVFLTGSIGSLILYMLKKHRASVIWSLLPLVNILCFIAGLAILMVFCNGNFTCHETLVLR